MVFCGWISTSSARSHPATCLERANTVPLSKRWYSGVYVDHQQGSGLHSACSRLLDPETDEGLAQELIRLRKVDSRSASGFPEATDELVDDLERETTAGAPNIFKDKDFEVDFN